MKGFKYLIQAAKAGDRHCMIMVARAFDTGLNLSADRSVGEPLDRHTGSPSESFVDWEINIKICFSYRI